MNTEVIISVYMGLGNFRDDPSLFLVAREYLLADLDALLSADAYRAHIGG